MKARDLQEALISVSIVRRLYFFEETSSTSDWARDLLVRQGGSTDAHGTLVVANHQTAGRGRQQRQWSAPPGSSLLFSLVLNADISPRPNYVLAAALAVVRAMTAMIPELAPRLKYPNDIMLGGAKACGILAEQVTVQQRPFVVLGVGLNVLQQTWELPVKTRVPATSLRIASGREVDRGELLRRILEQLDDCLKLGPEQTASIAAGLCETIGRFVEVASEAGTIAGIATGLSQDGALLVREPSGIERAIYSGEVLQLQQ